MKYSLGLLMAVGVALFPGRADAGPFCSSTSNCTFDLNLTNVGGFGSGTFGTVNLLLLGNQTIQFTVDLAGNQATGFHLIDTGSHFAFLLNVNDAIAGPVGTVTLSGFSDAAYSQASGGPFSQSGYGSFDLAVQSSCTNGGGCGVNLLTFIASRAGGFSDVSQLIRSNNSAIFSADVGNAQGVTGPIAGNSGGTGITINSVPEPSTFAMIGVGILGLAFARRKRR